MRTTRFLPGVMLLLAGLGVAPAADAFDDGTKQWGHGLTVRKLAREVQRHLKKKH